MFSIYILLNFCMKPDFVLGAPFSLHYKHWRFESANCSFCCRALLHFLSVFVHNIFYCVAGFIIEIQNVGSPAVCTGSNVRVCPCHYYCEWESSRHGEVSTITRPVPGERTVHTVGFLCFWVYHSISLFFLYCYHLYP